MGLFCNGPFTEDRGKYSEVWLPFGIKNGGSYRIRFINSDDDNDTSLRVLSIISLEDDQVSKVLPVLNTINNKYRYFKFVCDKDNDINLEYDFPLQSVHPEKCAFELIIRATKIIDDAFPMLMQSIWS